MQQDAISNPFVITQYNYSWADIKEHVNEIVNRFPNRYKIAHDYDEEQKIVIFASFDFNVFAKDKNNLIFISKIDACRHTTMLAYEAKHYNNDIIKQADVDRGQYFIDAFMEDMMLVY